jgi:hypothetical protein
MRRTVSPQRPQARTAGSRRCATAPATTGKPRGARGLRMHGDLLGTSRTHSSRHSSCTRRTRASSSVLGHSSRSASDSGASGDGAALASSCTLRSRRLRLSGRGLGDLLITMEDSSWCYVMSERRLLARLPAVCPVCLSCSTLSLEDHDPPGTPRTCPQNPSPRAARLCMAKAHGFQVFHDPSRYSARFMSEEASPAA